MNQCTAKDLHPKSQPPVAGALASTCPRELSAAALAHDLRTPLNAIHLSMQAARLSLRSGRPPDLGSLTSQIDRNIRMALALLDTLVAARQLQVTERKLTRAAVRLDEVAHETAEAMQPITGQAGVHLKLRVEPVSIYGDRVRLGRVMSNLLANAIRHSPRDTSIELAVNRHRSSAVCHVADQGPGVPNQDRSRIFEPHFRGSGSPGTAGLGLFICRRIVELHGGRIWVEDHFPRGAHFIFTLPLSPKPSSTQTCWSPPKQ